MQQPTDKLNSIIDVLQWLQDNGLSDHAEVVGKWVWVEFEAKPGIDIIAGLKAAGFHWNRKRECWQHPCGHHSLHSPADSWYLKSKYGAHHVAAPADETVAA